MKRAILICLKLLTVLGAASAFSAPSCWPTPINAVAGKLPDGVSTVNTHYVVWRCPDNTLLALAGTMAEATQWISQVLGTGIDPAAAIAEWNANVGNQLTPEERGFIRSKWIDHFDLAPLAMTAVAYKQRQNIDSVTFVPIGTLPVGTPCVRLGKAGNYMPVSRSAVTMSSRFDPKPLVVFAKCG